MGEETRTTDSAGVRVEPLVGDSLAEREGRLVIPASGAKVNDEVVRSLRDVSQRSNHGV